MPAVRLLNFKFAAVKNFAWHHFRSSSSQMFWRLHHSKETVEVVLPIRPATVSLSSALGHSHVSPAALRDFVRQDTGWRTMWRFCRILLASWHIILAWVLKFCVLFCCYLATEALVLSHFISNSTLFHSWCKVAVLKWGTECLFSRTDDLKVHLNRCATVPHDKSNLKDCG